MRICQDHLRCAVNHLRTTRTTTSGEVFIGKADRKALEAFYQAHHDLIYRYAYRSVRNREEAEDLTSQIFLKVASGLDDTHRAKVAKLWLFQLTRTTIADYWRTHARATLCSLEALLDTGWEGPMEEPRSLNVTATNRVQLLLQALPTQYREVLTCRFLLNDLDHDNRGGRAWGGLRCRCWRRGWCRCCPTATCR